MTTFKKPDLNAPRFRGTRMSLLNLSTVKLFKDQYPQYKDLDPKQFKEIIKTFNQNIVKGIINNRNGVELPSGLGFVFMGNCPPAKKLNIDFKNSVDTGVQMIHKNWDSDNRLMKLFYTNHHTKYPFQNKQVWAFKGVKQFRKAASEAFKENPYKYIEVLPTEKISKMFQKQRKKEYAQNLKPVVPESYNEFEL